MLDDELVPCADVQRAMKIFNRDGFVALEGVLSAEQLAYAQGGAPRVVTEQTGESPSTRPIEAMPATRLVHRCITRNGPC